MANSTIYCKTKEQAIDTVRVYSKFGHDILDTSYNQERDVWRVVISDNAQDPNLAALEKKWWDCINAERYIGIKRRDYPKFWYSYREGLVARCIIAVLVILCIFLSIMCNKGANYLENEPNEADKFFAGFEDGKGASVEIIIPAEESQTGKEEKVEIAFNQHTSYPIESINGGDWQFLSNLTGYNMFDYKLLMLTCQKFATYFIIAVAGLFALWLVKFLSILGQHRQRKKRFADTENFIQTIEEKVASDKAIILDYLNSDSAGN